MVENLKHKINKCFWKIKRLKKCREEIFFKNVKPFENVTPNVENEIIKFEYEKVNKRLSLSEYYVIYNTNLVIEPLNSFAIYGFNTIIEETTFHKNQFPSLNSWIYYKTGLKKYETLKINEAILFDGNVGTNYFHFFTDVLHKIWLIEKFQLHNIPIIVGKQTFNKKFFQFFCQTDLFKNLQWVVQPQDCYIRLNRLHLLKAMPFDITYWLKLKEQAPDLLTNESKRKIFLNRSNDVGRCISNFNEIVPILNKYEIEIIDTNNMSFEEQVKIFSETNFLVGIHGAGLTNILFSDWSKLKFIEIQPQNRIASQYYLLSHIFGIKHYDAIMGGPIIKDEVFKKGAFYLSPEVLERAIIKALNTQ